jgi:hypothetical protein
MIDCGAGGDAANLAEEDTTQPTGTWMAPFD